jgi:hypothetical protein
MTITATDYALLTHEGATVRASAIVNVLTKLDLVDQDVKAVLKELQEGIERRENIHLSLRADLTDLQERFEMRGQTLDLLMERIQDLENPPQVSEKPIKSEAKLLKLQEAAEDGMDAAVGSSYVERHEAVAKARSIVFEAYLLGRGDRG